LGVPIAANFFTVLGTVQNVFNGTLIPTATGSGGIARNTLVPFEGAGTRESVGWFGLLSGALVGLMAL